MERGDVFESVVERDVFHTTTASHETSFGIVESQSLLCRVVRRERNGSLFVWRDCVLTERADRLDYLSPFTLDMIAKELLDVFNLSRKW